MALSKDYFIKEMRRRYPNLEDTPDEYVYIYGKQQNPTIAIEPFSDTVSGDPIMEQQSLNEDQTINTAPWYFDYIDYGRNE